MYSKDCPVIVHVWSLEQKDECDLKVIYKSGKHNHGGGKQERYSSESVIGRGRKRKYARGVNDDESELENDKDDGEDTDQSDDDE